MRVYLYVSVCICVYLCVVVVMVGVGVGGGDDSRVNKLHTDASRVLFCPEFTLCFGINAGMLLNIYGGARCNPIRYLGGRLLNLL